MAVERSSVIQAIYINPEATAGVEDLTTMTRLSGASISTNIELESKTYTAVGTKFAGVAVANKEWASGSLEGAATYGEMPYFLAGHCSYSVDVDQPTAGANTWEFTSSAGSLDTIKTFTVVQGSTQSGAVYDYWHSMKNCVFPDFGIDFSRDSIDVTGALLGTRFTNKLVAATFPTSTSTVELTPILPNTCNVYYGPSRTGDTLDSSVKLTRVSSASFSSTGKYQPVWSLDSSNSSYANIVETMPEVTLTLNMEYDDQGIAILENYLRTSTLMHVDIRADSGSVVIPGSSSIYAFDLRFCGVPTGVTVNEDQDGIFAVEFTLTAIVDPDWDSGAQAYKIQLVNGTTAL
jgi:hypothetical protein